MMAGPKGGPEDQGASEFHETDYYSKFQEQDGTLPIQDPETATPSAGKRAEEGGGHQAEEVDERAIQELMDAALRKGAGVIRDEPENLDVSIRADWRAPRAPAPRESAPSPKTPDGTAARPAPRPAIRKASDLAGEGKRGRRRRGSRLLSMRRIGFLLKGLGLALLAAGVGGAIYYYERIQREGISALLARAAEAHEAGNYQAANEYYSLARKVPGGLPEHQRARLALLQGGVSEQVFLQTGKPESWNAAMKFYDEVIAGDQTENRGYAVEAILARAELLATTAEGAPGTAEERFRMAERELVTLVEAPEYKHHPAITLGEAHRRLAAILEAEDPRRAIELLMTARDNQKYLEEGVENLAIARIHKDRLMDPVQAREFFELVRQNELASAKDRAAAETALQEIRGPSGEGIDLIRPELLEGDIGEGSKP